MFRVLSTPLFVARSGGPKKGVDKIRNMEHLGTFRNIPEHEKIKIIFMKKKYNKIIIIIK